MGRAVHPLRLGLRPSVRLAQGKRKLFAYRWHDWGRPRAGWCCWWRQTGMWWTASSPTPPSPSSPRPASTMTSSSGSRWVEHMRSHSILAINLFYRLQSILSLTRMRRQLWWGGTSWCWRRPATRSQSRPASWSGCLPVLTKYAEVSEQLKLLKARVVS